MTETSPYSCGSRTCCGSDTCVDQCGSKTCCIDVHCVPEGADCCTNGGYCPSGSQCHSEDGEITCKLINGGTNAGPTTTSTPTTTPTSGPDSPTTDGDPATKLESAWEKFQTIIPIVGPIAATLTLGLSVWVYCTKRSRQP